MAARLTVHVYTPQLERVRRFYEEGLGVRPSGHSPAWLPFELDGATFALHAVQHDDDRPVDHVNLTFVVDNIEAAVERCKQHGATVLRGLADEAFGRRAILQDPDGRKFEVVQHEPP